MADYDNPGEAAFKRLLGMLLPNQDPSVPYFGLGTEFGRPTGPGGGYEGYFKQPQYGFLEMGAQMTGRQLPTPRLEMPGRYNMQVDMMKRFRNMNQEAMWQSPTFEYIMTQGVGRATGRNFEQSKQLIQGNKMLNMIRSAGSYGWNMFASPYTDQYQQIPMMASEAYRQFSATPMQGPSGQFQMGFNYQQSKQFATKLYEATRGPSGMFQQGPFNPREMMEISTITQAYGGFSQLGAGKGEGRLNSMEAMVKRTKDVAKVIDVGMRVYGEMDKQKVVEKIMELTRGTVGLQNTGQIESLLLKVDAMARSANLSVDMMQKIAAEGADIARRVNITGSVGAVQAMQSVVTANAATAGSKALIGSSMQNFLGGQNQVIRMMAGINTGFMQMPSVQNIGAMVGGGMNVNSALGLMGQGPSHFDTEMLMLRRAQAQAAREGRPASDAYVILQNYRNPRLRMEGTSKLLEAMQEDPVKAMETQLSMIAGGVRGGMDAVSWNQILNAKNTDERETLLYNAMMRGMTEGGQIVDPTLSAMASGDPQNVLGIAGILSKTLPKSGDLRQLKLPEQMRTSMYATSSAQAAATIENISGMRNMENRSVYERFHQGFNSPGGADAGMASTTLEAILPSGGRLDADVMDDLVARAKGGGKDAEDAREFLKQAAQIGALDGGATQSAGNSLLAASKWLTGGMDIFEMGKKGTEANKRVNEMRDIFHRFKQADELKGEDTLKKYGADRDKLKAILDSADQGMDYLTVQKFKAALGAPGLSGADTADVMAALGASSASVERTGSMATSAKKVFSNKENIRSLREGMGKTGITDSEKLVKSLEAAAGTYRETLGKEHDTASGEMKDFVSKMGSDIALGIGRQFESDKKLSSKEKDEKDEAMAKVARVILGKNATADEAKKKLKEWGTQDTVQGVLGSITESISANKDLSPEQMQILQGQMGGLAQTSIRLAGEKTRAWEETHGKFTGNAQEAREATKEMYSELERAQKAYDSAEEGSGKDTAFETLKATKRRFEEQKGEFAKYGATQKELAAYKDIGPGTLEEILREISMFFRDMRSMIPGMGGKKTVSSAGNSARQGLSPVTQTEEA